MLDMRQVVGILDIARRMIRLFGYEVSDDDHSDGDIAVEVIGSRQLKNTMRSYWLGITLPVWGIQ